MAATTTPPSAAPAPALSKGQVFVRRLTSTAILWTIVLTAMFSGNELVSNGVFLLLMLVLTCVGLTEFTIWWQSGIWCVSSRGEFWAGCC